jgi:hypothetical protein
VEDERVELLKFRVRTFLYLGNIGARAACRRIPHFPMTTGLTAISR